MPDEWGGVEIEDEFGGVLVEDEPAPEERPLERESADFAEPEIPRPTFTMFGKEYPIPDQANRPPMPRAVSDFAGLPPETSRAQDLKEALPGPGEFAKRVMEPTGIEGAGQGVTALMTTTPEELKAQMAEAPEFRRMGEQLGAIQRPEVTPFAASDKPTTGAMTPIGEVGGRLAEPPEIPESVIFDTALQNELAKGVEELTTGENQAIMVGTMGAGSIPKIGHWLQRAVSGYFGYEGARAVQDAAKQLREATTPEGKAQAWAGIIKGAAIAVPATLHAVRPPPVPRPVETIIAKTEAAVPGALSKSVEALKKVEKPADKTSVETKPTEVADASKTAEAESQPVAPTQESAVAREPARAEAGQEREVLLNRGVGERPGGAPPREAPPAPAPVEATLTSRLEAADKMTGAELKAHEGEFGRGATRLMHEIGSKAKTAEDVATLKQAALTSEQKFKALMDAGDLDAAMAQAGKQLAEAYEYATGVKVDGTPKWTAFEKDNPNYKPSMPDAQYVKAKGGVEVKPQPTEKFEVSVQAEDPAYPGTGFIQIVDTAVKSEKVKSPTVESLRAAGVDVPDFSKLPTGKYTWKEAIEKARATEATTPAAADQTSIPARQAPVVEPGVGAVPENVSGAGATTPGARRVEPAAVAKPEVAGFKTSKGSEYSINESGHTTRLKKSAGKGQGEVHESLPVVFVEPEVQMAILEAGRSNERVIIGERDSSGNWSQIRPDATSDLRGKTLAIYTVDRATGKTTGAHLVTTTPEVGKHPFEIGYKGDEKIFHIGNKITSLSKSTAAKPAPAGTQPFFERESEAAGTAEPQSMGGLNPKTEQAKAQLAQLTDSIATLAAEGKSQPGKAFSLGETLSKAKDSATAALDGLKAAGSYMKLKLEGKPTATEYKGVLGDRHLALSESSVNARKWVQSVKKAVPDPKAREAISNWVDSGGDPALLTKAAGETKPQYKAGYERAQKLTPEEEVVAENLRNYFDSRLQEAIDAGVLEDGIENYIHRIYEQDSPWKKGVIQELRSGLFTGKPALAKQRVFEYDFEAEKAGKKPIKDFAQRVVAYDLALNKAIADRAAVKGMMEIKMSDGRPMIDVGGGGKVIENAAGEPQATIINRSAKKIDPNDTKANRGDYKPFDHPALRKWKWATEDTAGKPVFVQGDVLIHPEAIGDINKLLGRSAIRQNPVGRAALNVSSTIKQTMLDLSGFHPVQIAVHGTEHRTFAPVKEIDFTNPDVRGLIRGGAAVGETSGHAAFSEGLSGGSGSLTKHIPWVGERLQAYNSWLFEDYIPRLKVAMGLHALERNRARFKDLSPDQQYELTANQMNAAFGEQNYTMLGRSKTTQDALRLALLAPDFLEARSRFVAQAFTKYGAEQRQALLLGAATMYITARLINKMLDDEYHFEPKNAFNVVYGGKSYGLRTVQGDLIHAVTEPGKFINHRLNPVFGKPALEFVTGRDYFGRKRTVGEQLEDFVKTPVPIGVRGAFENQEQTLFESFLNSFGLVTKRDSAASDIAKLAADWRKENKISTGPGEFIYDADKDPFRDIKLAAERGDEAGVRSEVAKAMNAGLKRSRILEHFKLSATHYFAGSAANEKKFIASLTEDQKKIYRDAVAERKRIRETVRRAGFTP